MKNPVQAGKLLIVEDNPTNREVLENLLQKMGYGFSTVEDGWQAVNTVTTGSRPDLILMDCHMPVMDGFEATQRIRAWEAAQQQPRIPIIAVTAGALDEDRARCFSVGMDEFLTKPLNVQKLSETLCSHLGEEAPGAPSAPALPNADTPLNKLARLQAVRGINVSDGLQNVGGRSEMLLRMLRRFLDSHQGDLASLRQLLACGERDQATRLMHTLKGVSATLGVSCIQTLAADLERALRQPDTTLVTLETQILQAEETWQRLMNELAPALAEEAAF